MDVTAGQLYIMHTLIVNKCHRRSTVSHNSMHDPIIHEQNRVIHASNYSADRPTLSPSQKIVLLQGKQLMPQHAGLIVTETVDAGLLGEGIWPSLKEARRSLLQPGRIAVMQ